jgi:rubrerythrin
VYSPQLVVELARLLVMEVDAVRAYANATPRLDPGPIRDELALIGREHAAHADELREAIAFRGYLPPDPVSEVEGIVLGGGATGQAGPEAAVEAVRRNELLVASLYAKVLAKGPPEGAVELLERLRGEAERHRGWAERALARRAWEDAGPSP